jgi:hypothetical protein
MAAHLKKDVVAKVPPPSIIQEIQFSMMSSSEMQRVSEFQVSNALESYFFDES